jgi:hypothetical protein
MQNIMVVTFIVLTLDALLILGLLWVCANALYQQKRAIVTALDPRRVGAGLRILIVAPPLIALAIIILSFFVAQSDFFASITHALYLLGLWLATALLVFSYLLFSRLKNTLQFAAILGFLCSIIPVLYLTPIDSFHTFFGQAGQVGYIFPLVVSVLIIGMCYIVLLRLNRALH